jgi:hypothetical protein
MPVNQRHRRVDERRVRCTGFSRCTWFTAMQFWQKCSGAIRKC